MVDGITIYTKPGCPHCAAAKEDLRQRAAALVAYSAQSDPAALRHMLELNGSRHHVPTVVDGERATIGFDGY